MWREKEEVLDWSSWVDGGGRTHEKGRDGYFLARHRLGVCCGVIGADVGAPARPGELLTCR